MSLVIDLTVTEGMNAAISNSCMYVWYKALFFSPTLIESLGMRPGEKMMLSLCRRGMGTGEQDGAAHKCSVGGERKVHDRKCGSWVHYMVQLLCIYSRRFSH